MPIYRRGQVWYVDVQYQGERIKKSCGAGSSRSYAKALEAEILTRLRNQSAGVYYLDDAIDKWLTEYVPRMKSARWINEHANIIKPYCTGKLLEQAPDAIADYLAANPTSAPATHNNRIRIVRRVCNLAFDEWRWLEHPIGKRIKTLSGVGKRTTYLSIEQIDEICQHINNEGVCEAVWFAAYSGLRLGELLNIGPENVREGRLYLTANTKSGKPRTVPLPKQIKDIPLPIRATRNMIQQWFRKASRKAGHEGLRFHDLRHTYASWLLQKGVALSVIQELLGHSSILITRDLYAHLESSQLDAAVELLD